MRWYDGVTSAPLLEECQLGLDAGHLFHGGADVLLEWHYHLIINKIRHTTICMFFGLVLETPSSVTSLQISEIKM